METKTLKLILFTFTFEIVLACSSSSPRTISGTNTYKMYYVTIIHFTIGFLSH